MFTTGSKLLIGSSVIAIVAAVLYGVTQQGTLGTIGLISAAVALVFLAAINVFVRDSNVSAMDIDAHATAPAARRPPGRQPVAARRRSRRHDGHPRPRHVPGDHQSSGSSCCWPATAEWMVLALERAGVGRPGLQHRGPGAHRPPVGAADPRCHRGRRHHLLDQPGDARAADEGRRRRRVRGRRRARCCSSAA